jgi:hypothetical protein
MRQDPAAEVENRPQPLVELVRGQAGFLQQIVVFHVLARMHGFLADEAEHLLLQHRVVDLIAVVTHAVHEKTLAGRKQQRKRVEEVCHMRALHVPIAGTFLRQVETKVAANRHHGLSPCDS